MKSFSIIILVWTFNVNAQTEGISDYSKDVSSVDAIIKALYESISGEAGAPRQWERFFFLMAEDARLIPTSESDSGNTYKSYTPRQYKERAEGFFKENAFFEYEIYRDSQSYGRIVHLFSTYGAKRSLKDPEPFNKGINSIQLFYDSDRWWILTIYWAHQSTGNPIPARYLGPGK